MKKLSKILRWLIYILPAVLLFSYYPIIPLGVSETMNFELSLPMIWLVVFDVISLVILVRQRDFSFFKKWRWLLFPIFATVSLAWSDNLVRSVLTVGIIWLVVFAIYAILRFRKEFLDARGFSYTFLKFFFASALAICAWCVVQCVMDVMGVPRDYTLLCRGCVYQMFGFPHPNGFAIEPQFMGNLLLAPTLVAIYLEGANILSWAAFARPVATGGRRLSSRCRAPEALRKNIWRHLSILFTIFILTFTLFLTFSRGAIYAFIVGLIFMSAAMIVKKTNMKRILAVWGVVALAFLAALNVQGILAQVSPTNDTYVSGVSKVLNHLSLGIIDIRGTTEEVSVEEGEVATAIEESVFDGYVEESTNIRTELTHNAIKVWSRDFRTMVFGVGIGGAGQAMYNAGLTGSPKEIVQNEYASLLLETGAVGILLAILLVVMIVKNIRKNPMSIIIMTLGVSYGVSLLFFSGLANALQIYLLPPVLYIVLRKKLVS